MPINLKGRSFLTLKDFTQKEIRYLLDLSHELKAKKLRGDTNKTLIGKNIVLLFEKASTRTRCAFEVAALDEGAGITFLDQKSSQIGKKESIEDSAKVLGRFYDGIEYRGFEQSIVEDLAKYSGVPVYNGLTDTDHPTQVLADMLTMEEHINKPLNKIKLIFCGDIRNNMSNALMIGAAKMGMHYVCYGPKELVLDINTLNYVTKLAKQTGAVIEITDNPNCLKNADVIYTDVWVSMGEEDKIKERVELLSPYKVTRQMLEATNNTDILFLHCLPAFHDFKTDMAKECIGQGIDICEVEDEVFRSKNSKVFDQAENRLHTIKAVLVATL
ncbi:MAG: ornithine carbamoyltransferase [Defluviitaleaceae bacterium]|nr:ornithine carbamoyltransferase [Defluviitaleaceae bacterium]